MESRKYEEREVSGNADNSRYRKGTDPGQAGYDQNYVVVGRNIDFEIRPMDQMRMEKACCEPSAYGSGSYDIDIEPEDIEVSDTVTVVWQII